ncbi:hypothetical protein [Paenibacillus thermotolerans]|uniref:hypothetical protein n=1 Tax=Paenibacillus thermotolerans TaxID=3027807 RepID=UPI0023689CE6|nr:MULTISPECIES: hypothetical protein [unclassified Paenibacillus]
MKKIAVYAMVVLAVLLLAGCGERGAAGSGHGAGPVELESVPEHLIKLKDVFAEHGVQAKSAYSDEQTVFLEVRKLKDHRSALTEEETERLKKALFQAIGGTFPLEVQSFVISEEPEMKGEITAIDGKRVLVVDRDKLIGTEIKEPDAAWYSLSSDTALVDSDTGGEMAAGDLRIGFQVNVWSDGMMLTSYPGQTTALRLEVTDSDTGEEDIRGTVDEISIDEEDQWQSYLVVSGEKLRLMPFTLYWEGDRPASVEQIETGTRVQAWFVGYDLGTAERMVSQVKVVP